MWTLLLLSALAASPPRMAAPPPDWKMVKDSKGLCQIAVPPDWEALSESSGAAVLQDAGTAIAVVTSQAGQPFKPLTDGLVKAMGIRTGKLFENSAVRVFYQDRTSKRPDEPNAYSASVPAKAGTCSCHVTILPSVAEDTGKRIALTLRPAQ